MDRPPFVWMIDAFGKTEDVVAAVKKQQLEAYKVLVRDMSRGGLHVEIDVAPTDEDFEDFENARESVLRELERITTPYAGANARYMNNANKDWHGGYVFQLSVTAFERI